MRVLVIGAGAMGSALTVPLRENGVEVAIYGTEYDVELLKLIEKGEKHPRIGVSLDVEVFYPDELHEAMKKADLLLLAVSTEGVIPTFRRIKDDVDGKSMVTIAKGLLEVDGKILTIPEFIVEEVPSLASMVVAITGPSIAREVANKAPTRVVFSCEDYGAAKDVAKLFETEFYRVTVSTDIVGTEITSALKNIYSIGIAWVRGYEERKGGIEMSNLKGVIATMAIGETARFVEAMGGKKETVYGLSGFGDLIATFRGGRNGMLGELLGKGLSVKEALEELKRRGVGVIEGYENAKKAYKLFNLLKSQGKVENHEFPLLTGIYDVLYNNRDVGDVLYRIV
ncbi:glycerol-3-phosphate dehydrogenase [Archaeoglobales archaeon]|nr:MAG: glycerol-3-phosphate dehydrogenase [Archaeoglobales archaeon]